MEGSVRLVLSLLMLVALLAPGEARAQQFLVHGAAGPIVNARGSSLAAGIGLTAGSRVTILGSFDRTHVPTKTTPLPRGVAYERGGTLTLGTGEVQISLFDRSRVSPYGVVGFGGGTSRPNVNDIFPNPVTNTVVAPFAGGGIRIPLRDNLTLSGDIRWMLAAGTDADDLIGVAPLRAGIALKF
jgi:hypothetical protein